ncbi:MAG TPA: ABC transporter substrate-binding protein, partial [Microlunatus sp.]|nr:ABC transporter substrate-binding protein [Microlunatus sp.]
MRRHLRVAAAACAMALMITGCNSGGGQQPGSGGGEQPVLNIHASSTPTFQANFNPISVTFLPGTRGMIYEPLIAYTPMKPNEGQPWLAEKAEFNADGTELTIDLRSGVTWSDGEAFDADDVAYTFNLFAEQPAANTGALPVESAKKVDADTVTVTFSEPAFARMPAIGNTTPLPEHIFSEQDPVEFTNAEPVGTGPYKLKSFSEQIYTLEKNPNYWDADSIKVEQLAFPASTTQTFTTSLQQGKLDWAGGFVANIDQIFVAKDPEHNKYWFPGDGAVNLLVNQRRAPFDDLELRKALSLAIDRQVLSDTAMQGYTPPAHPTGLVLPAFESAMDPQYQDAKFEHDPARANQLLDDAGYQRGPDGIRTSPDGKKLSFDLVIPSGYVDWVAMSKLLQEQLKEVGIEIKPQGVATQNWAENRNNGKFDVTIAAAAGGTAPYFLYRSMLSSEFKAADDKPVTSNYSRWYDKETDELFAEYESSDDPARQQTAIAGLQKIMVEELPLIPLL